MNRRIRALAVLLSLCVPLAAVAASKPVQWKQGERVPPLTAAELDAAIAAWKADLRYRTMTDAEREKLDAQYQAEADKVNAKREARQQCAQTAISQQEAMDMQKKLAEKMMANPGDMKLAQKLGEDMQKDFEAKVAKKCGPVPADPIDPRTGPTGNVVRITEWLTTYVQVRREKDAATAAKVVLASPEEVALVEARLAALKELVAAEKK